MKAILRILVLQVRHAPWRFVGGILLALVPLLAGLALLGVAGWFITAAAIAGLTGVFLNIFVPSALIRGFAIARTAGRYGERLLTHDVTFRFLANLRMRVFKGAAVETLSEGRATRSAQLLNRMTTDIAALDAIYLRLVVPICLSLLTFCLAALVFGGTALWAVLPLAIFAGVMASLFRLAGGHADRQAARRQEAALDAVRVRSVDLVAGRRDLAIYGGLDGAAAKVEGAAERLNEADVQDGQRSAQLASYSFLAGQILFAALLVILGEAVLGAKLDVAVAVALLLFGLALPEVFVSGVPGALALARTKLAARRILPNVEEADLFDRSFPQMIDEGGRASSGEGGDAASTLEFEAVSFRYRGASEPVVRDLSFAVGEGEIVALTGRSGCGKSTVSALASALIQPESGTVRLLGQPLADWHEADLRRSVTVLSQRPYLFHGSIADNLRIANPQASDADLWAALDVAALGDRIRADAAGLAAIVGEGGLGLSGGEQRRLGLARAYLTSPAFWILDEMTEGLDEATAEDVLARFLSFRAEAAVLMIAHKQQEIDKADRILRLTDKGLVD